MSPTDPISVQSVRLSSEMGADRSSPALLSTTSTCPKVSTAAATMARAPVSVATVSGHDCAFPPSARKAAATAWAASSLTSLTNTAAPR